MYHTKDFRFFVDNYEMPYEDWTEMLERAIKLDDSELTWEAVKGLAFDDEEWMVTSGDTVSYGKHDFFVMENDEDYSDYVHVCTEEE